MGCTASKLDNEDTVRRCKERRRLMKEAVFARHHLAASHSDYCRSLRLTGAALSAFADGEPLQVLTSTPPVVLHPQPSLSRSSTLASTPSLRRPSPAIATSNLPPAVPATVTSPTRRHKSIRVPHILSDSSPYSSPSSHVSSTVPGGNKHHFPTYYAVPNTSDSSTPSQTSSLWNWENFRPPSPPGSEYFHQLRERTNPMDTHRSETLHRRDPADSEFSHGGGRYTPTQSKNAGFYGGVGGDDDDDRRSRSSLHHGDEMEREEVQCSEWDDHYSTTSSSSDGNLDLDADADRDSLSEMGIPSRFGSSAAATPVPAPPSFPGIKKPEKFDDVGSSVSWNGVTADGGAGATDMKMVVSHKDLKEILDATKEYFDKEAATGERLSEMLETGRAQLDRSFSQLKKTLYHSSNVFSNLSSNWTSKPPLAVKYQLNTSSLVESGGSKSLLSTLERLLAWEKKLYEEVKAREGAKIGHEKKLSTLKSQEYKGDQTKLDKTKASIKRLQSIIIVTSQAVSTTSSAISSLKDTDLIPLLTDFCHELKYMWRAMNEYHEIQSCIIQQVGGLVNRAVKGDMTTDLHRQVTRELESAVSAWHFSFCRLMKYQRDLIQSLHGWFKLTVIPISDDDAQGTQGSSEVLAFLDEWKLAIERVPDTVASGAIKSFVNVVHAISAKQAEELKIKKRTEAVSKELEKKAKGIRNLEMKFYQSYSMVGVGLQNTQPDNGHLVDSQDPLAEKKLELAACRRRVEDEMLRHSKAVEVTRSMTLNNIQTGLPGVFQALTSFSAVCVEALEAVCTRSYAIK